MEDEKNLDLSLGLPCGGGSSSLKGKQGSSSDNTLDDGDRDRKLINEFKNFLEGGIQHPLKDAKNAYDNNSKTFVEIESSRSSASGGMWMSNDSRSGVETERSTLGAKRNNLSSEMNQPKKHERETIHQELPEKTHISITTDEGSTAEKEDVADSEVDGSTSRQASHPEDVSKRFIIASGNLSRVQKAMNMTNVQYGASVMSYSQQPMKDYNSSSMPTLSSYSIPGMMHANSERPGIQSVMPANSPLMFGYNPVQLPTLDKDNSQSTFSHHQPILPTYPGRNSISSGAQDDSRKLTQATMPVTFQKSPESTQHDRRTIEHRKINGKQHVGEESSSGNAQGDPAVHLARDGSHQHRSEPLPSEFPAIRPGVAADLKFGGCGSYPNLPWVSTTGPGPNGRTISGVTYRYSPTQIRIVCACHGSHLSPGEFVGHASEENGTRDSVPGFGVIPKQQSCSFGSELILVIVHFSRSANKWCK